MKKNPMEVLPTEGLEAALEETRPEKLNRFFRENEEALLSEEYLFSDYMKAVMNQKGITISQALLKGRVDNIYGYRILSGERRVKDRDIILKICFGANFNLRETQRALQLGGYGKLYW